MMSKPLSERPWSEMSDPVKRDLVRLSMEQKLSSEMSSRIAHLHLASILETVNDVSELDAQPVTVQHPGGDEHYLRMRSYLRNSPEA